MNCIVNVTPDWGIGCAGRLAVSIHADLKRFRALTTGGSVLLGRKTLATFPGGRPLKNRRNLILTHDPAFSVEGAEVLHSVDAALARAASLGDTLWLIGGESIYRQFLPYCSLVRLTRTFVDVPCDAFFPDLDKLTGWSVCWQSEPMEEDGIRFQYLDYCNASPLPVSQEVGA